MADSLTLDSDDRRLVRALLIDPRVPFATLASVLERSEPTVARRYARMRRTGALRVTGVVDRSRLGQSQCTVRLRCRPGSVGTIAQALAQREDVGWVAISTGGGEITCAVRSRTPADRDDLLGTKLPRAAALLDLQTSVMLRKFLGGRGRYWAALAGSLTESEESRLRSTGRPFEEEPVGPHRSRLRLDEQDDGLLAALAADGRASLAELATAAGMTPGRAGRRLATLLSEQLVHLHVEIAPAALGYRTLANLWLRVRPDELKAVGRSLAALPEVGFVAAMSGRDNLHAVVHCHDLDELFEFTSGQVGSLPGVEAAEVSVIDRQIKQAGTMLDGDRLAQPAGRLVRPSQPGRSSARPSHAARSASSRSTATVIARSNGTSR